MQLEATPTFVVPGRQAELSDWEIENPHKNRDEHFDLNREEFDVAPPIWDGPDFTHETVQTPVIQQIEARPSVQEQHNNMTDAQNIAYIGALTPHVARMRSQFVLAA